MKGITRTTSPFILDSYGTRVNRVTRLHKPDNIYANSLLSNMLVLIFVLIDFFCISILWNFVQTENPEFILFISCACAISLDVPLAIAAVAIKKYHHGISSRNEAMIITIISVIIFVIAFVFSFMFRIVTKDYTFVIEDSSAVVDSVNYTVVDSTKENISIWFAALFNGIIPLLTSLSSFVISYFSYSPVEKKIKRLETERVKLQSNVLEADKALVQSEDAVTHCNALLARENDLYFEFISKLDAENQTLKQLARLVIMEKLRTADDVSSLTDSAKSIYVNSEFNDTPSSMYSEFVSSQIGTNSEI